MPCLQMMIRTCHSRSLRGTSGSGAVAAASVRLRGVVLSRRTRVSPFSLRRWPRWTADVQACAAVRCSSTCSGRICCASRSSRPRPHLFGRSAWRASSFFSCAHISAGAAEGKNTRKNSLPALVWQRVASRANSRRRRSALRRHRAHLVGVVRAAISGRRRHAERV